MTKDGSKKTYVCRKLRVHTYLTEHGFKPYRIVPDMRDPNRLVWLYEDNGKVRDAVEDYYHSDTFVNRTNKNDKNSKGRGYDESLCRDSVLGGNDRKEKRNGVRTKEVFSMRMAAYLRQRGFEIIDMGTNPNRPKFDTWMFEDTPQLRRAMLDFNADRHLDPDHQSHNKD